MPDGYNPTPNIGQDGQAAPTYNMLIAGQDGSGNAQALLVGTDGRAKVDTGLSLAPASAVYDDTAAVVTAGSAVQLPNRACNRVRITAGEGNSGTLVVGAATVVAALVGRRGVPYFASQGDWHNVSNSNLLYIDSTANGDTVSLYYEA